MPVWDLWRFSAACHGSHEPPGCFSSVKAQADQFLCRIQVDGIVGPVLAVFQDNGYNLHNIEINRDQEMVSDLIGTTCWVGLSEHTDHMEILHDLSRFKGVKHLHELAIM